MRHHRRVPLALAAAIAVASQLAAQVQTAVIAASADATLFGSNALLANGGGDHLFAGVTNHADVCRCLLRFDVAAVVPPSARVVSAELQLTIDRTFHFAVLPVAVHRVLAAWTEGPSDPPGNEGGGAAAMPGDTTWLHRSVPAVPWGVAGGEFDPLPSASCATPETWVPVAWPATPRLVADVQAWIDAPAANHGWLLRTDEALGGAIRRFASRTNPIAAARPVLRVTYVMPGATGTVAPGCAAAAPAVLLTGTLLPATAIAVTVHGGPGNTFAALFGAGGLALPAVAIVPGCHLLIDPLAGVPLGAGPLDANGRLAASVTIPASPSFAGFTLTAQAVLDAAIAPGFELSAAAIALLP